MLTLFPEAFAGAVEFSMMGRAVQRGLVTVSVVDIRSFATDRHGTADDYQFRGRPGHGAET